MFVSHLFGLKSSALCLAWPAETGVRGWEDLKRSSDTSHPGGSAFPNGWEKAYLTDRRSERLTLELMAEISQFFFGIKVKSQICLSKVVIIHTDWWFWILSAFFSLSDGQWSVMVSDWVLSVMETCLSSKALCFKSVAYFKQLWRFPKLLQHHTMRAP